MHRTAALPGIWDLGERQEPRRSQTSSKLRLGNSTLSTGQATLQPPALPTGPLRGRTHLQKGRRIRRVPIPPEDGPSQSLANQKASFNTASGCTTLELLFPELSGCAGAGGGDD